MFANINCSKLSFAAFGIVRRIVIIGTESKFFFDQVLVAKGNKTIGIKPLDKTFLTELKGTNLKGVALLGNDGQLGTETTLIKYFEAQQKDRAAVVRRQRNYPGPYYINLAAFGLNP